MTQSWRGVLLAGCVLALNAGHAQAGFQWTAPAAGSVVSSAPMAPARPAELPPRSAAAPIAPVTSEALPGNIDAIASGAPIATMPDGPASAAPIFGNGMTNDPITWNQPHNAPRAPQNIMPAQTAGMPAPFMAPIVQAPVGYGMYEVAQGFGRDLPLVMAMRQVVPAQYGFVFDEGIDVSSRVSWQGGKPWDVVLQDMLSPLGVAATINGNVVTVGRGGGSNFQMASAGPQVMTGIVQETTVMPMSATPVAMTSAAPVVEMGGIGGGYVNARTASSADLLATTTWTAPRNSTLRNILEGWSGRVGVELYWASEYDYPIQSAVSVNGTFEEAVQTLLKGLADSKPRPMGRLHPNLPNGPAVLVIETRQNAM